MNNTTAKVDVPLTDIVVVTLIYGVVSFFGLLLHVVVMWAIAKQPNSRSGFYVMMQNLNVTNVIMLMLYLFYTVPVIIALDQVFGDLFGAMMGALEEIDFVAGLLATFFISFSRALAIGAEKFNDRLFNYRMCVIYSVLCWVIACFIFLLNWIMFRCLTFFDEIQFFFYDFCYDTTSTFTVTPVFIYIFVYGVAVFYLYAVYAITRQFRDIASENVRANSRRHRLRLLLQAFIIWLGLLCNVISYRVVPLFLTGMAALLTTGTLVLGHTVVAPICLIIFSKDIRSTISTLFKRIGGAARIVTQASHISIADRAGIAAHR